jgi:hypothetical protein
MATYTVTRAKSASLAANTVDTVTLDASVFGAPSVALAVVNRDATNPITFTVDGTTPTVLGDNFYVAAPGQTVVVPYSAASTVKLISTATSAYTVQAVTPNWYAIA